MADLKTIPALKSAINTRIYTNENYEVSAQDIQDSFTDTIDTLRSLGITSTTYGDLETKVSNSELSPGAFYSFEYEAKHYIRNTSITPILNIDVPTYPANGIKETLIVQAISVNSFSFDAISLDYPSDEIKYDFSQNFVLDLNDVPTATAKTGEITYRKAKDQLGDISAYYDIRNDWTAHFALDPTSITVAHTDTSVSKSKGNVIYLTTPGAWGGNSLETGYYLVTQDNTDLTVDIQNPNYSELLKPVSSYENSYFTQSQDNSNIPVDLSSVVYSQSIDISTCYGIEIGHDCTNLFIQNAQNIKIKQSSSSITINEASSIDINDAYNIVLKQCQLINFDFNIGDITAFGLNNANFKNGSREFLLESSENIEIGIASSESKILSSYDLTIGSNCVSINDIDSTGNTLGSGCSNIFLHNSNSNKFDQNCTTIQVYGGSNNTFGSGCSTINFLGDRDFLIGGTGFVSPYSEMNFNTFGSGCENITFNALGGRGNYFGDECKNLSFTDPNPLAATNRLVGCSFCRGIQNKSFEAVMHGCSFIVPNQETATITPTEFRSQLLVIDDTTDNNNVKYYTESETQTGGYNYPNSIGIGFVDPSLFFAQGAENNNGDPIKGDVAIITGKAYIWTYNGYPLNATMSIRTAPSGDPTLSLNR